MSVADLDKEYHGFFSKLSSIQRNRMGAQTSLSIKSKSCRICNNFKDGLRCDLRYHKVDDCWMPVGTVLVWDHESVV